MGIRIDPAARLYVLIISGLVLVLLCIIMCLIIVTFWVPAQKPVDTHLRYYTPCEQNLASQDCEPIDVYTNHCGPTADDPRCENFCQGLSPTDPRFCDYIDSCGKFRPGDFSQRCSLCTSDGCYCSPTDVIGCPEPVARQFCLGGISNCEEYCNTLYLCSWLDSSHTSAMRPVCSDLNACHRL